MYTNTHPSILKHVFFDLDNTLWDFNKNSRLTLKVLFDELDIQEQHSISFNYFHTIYKEINQQLWVAYRESVVDKEMLRTRRFRETLAKCNIFDKKVVAYFDSHYLNRIIDFNHLNKNAEKTLAALKKRYHIHVLSNGFSQITHRKISQSKLQPYIQTIVSSECAQACKPHSSAFYYALRKADAHIDETIYIGDDWVADIEGAKNIGMACIYYKPDDRTCTPIHNVVKISDLQELINILL